MIETGNAEFVVSGLTWTERALAASEASAATASVAAYLDRDGKKFTQRSALARYGYDYSDKPIWLRDIPVVFEDLAIRLAVQSNSVSLAKYEPMDRIQPHIDLPCWYSVSILNLGGSCDLAFDGPEHERATIKMQSGDLLQLTGDSLRTWKHSAFATRQRYSIVFRCRLFL